ncbi:MAG: alpha/beta hydrolase [Anaerolineales bacterium]|nr:alpha/beta hydrolase [Anaerolineales bacterium]
MPIAADLFYFLHKSKNSKRPPLILIHGAGGNYLSWSPQIRRMDAGAIYALDLSGHGRSSGAGRRSIDEYADDVIAFMRALDISAAFIAGVSMGGAIALTLALKYTDKVLGLALLGAGAKMRVAATILETVGNADTFAPAVELINQNCFSAKAPPSLLELSKRQMMEMRPQILLNDFLACNEFNAITQLPRVLTPTLLICGAEDQMTPVKYSQFLRDAIPNARLQIIENAGHLVMLEKPDIVAELLKDFIDKIAANKNIYLDADKR